MFIILLCAVERSCVNIYVHIYRAERAIRLSVYTITRGSHQPCRTTHEGCFTAAAINNSIQYIMQKGE